MKNSFLISLLVASGCSLSVNDPGTDPLPAQFYFPSGIAIDPSQPLLYVSGANADLRYAGGIVQVVDLARFDRALADYRAQKPSADTGLCAPDPIDPNVIACDETPFVFGNQTVKVGNFAGDIRVLTTGAATRRLFVGVRGDPSITWIDVDASNASAPVLDCFDDLAAARAQPNQPPACDGSHLVRSVLVTERSCPQGSLAGQCPSMIGILPPEPFGMALDVGAYADGTAYQHLLVSHLGSGQVSLIDRLDTPNPTVEYVSAPFFTSDATGHRGAFALAPQHPGQGLSLWYLTSNVNPQIATFRVAQANAIVPSQTFSLSGVFQVGNDVRDVAFQPDGARAFFTENNPPSVFVVDTRPNATSADFPANQIVDVLDVCQEPSHMLPLTFQLPGAPGEPPLVQNRLYVVCFVANQVMVVDADTPQVLDTILLGRGPNDIVFDERDGFTPRRRLYVSDFADWTISMIDLDPGSPTENRVVARIGLPVPPQVP